jgi:hypothetical protein
MKHMMKWTLTGAFLLYTSVTLADNNIQQFAWRIRNASNVNIEATVTVTPTLRAPSTIGPINLNTTDQQTSPIAWGGYSEDFWATQYNHSWKIYITYINSENRKVTMVNSTNKQCNVTLGDIKQGPSSPTEIYVFGSNSASEGLHADIRTPYSSPCLDVSLSKYIY